MALAAAEARADGETETSGDVVLRITSFYLCTVFDALHIANSSEAGNPFKDAGVYTLAAGFQIEQRERVSCSAMLSWA